MARQPLRNEDLHSDLLSHMGVEDDDDTTGSVVGDDDPDNDDLGGDDGDDDHLDDDADGGDDDDGGKAKRKKEDDDDDVDDTLTRRYAEDKNKNLVDANGAVIAKAGKERTIFERQKAALATEQKKTASLAHRLRQVAEAGQLALTKYNELKQSADYYKTVGLDEKQAKEAVDLYARFNSDPRGALQYIMTKVHLSGVDLKDIGVTQPIDAKAVADEAIRRHMETTKPVEKTPQELALEEAKSFMKRFPDSYDLRDIISEAKRRYPEKSLDEIYVRLKIHDAVQALARKFGLDLKRPPRQPQRGQQPQQRGRPEQRNAPVAHNSVDQRGKRRALDLTPRDHKQSFEDIGKDLLRDIKALEGR